MGDVWSALSDPSRRKMLELLRKKDLTAGKIAENFNMSKPSISHHLNILRNSGLVYSEKQGQNILYSINTTVFQEILELIAKLANVHGGEDDEEL